ncbi:MAG: hypothetical protein J6D47_21240 [Peptostreptococcaceae bacterium]|nr:hypothetical protein [Peptostreptococcaceae bacterium]
MYSNFNIKKDKDLILLNYYIEQNLQGNSCSLSASLVSEALGIERTKAYRLIKKLEDLQVIKCVKKGTGGSILSTYEYAYATRNETVSETVNEIGNTLKLNKYGEMYKSFHKRSSNVQLRELQEIQGLNNIDMELFEYLIVLQKDDESIKSKYKYFVRTIQNAIKDKVFSLEQYKESQNKRYNMKEVNKFNYMDSSHEDDFELLARKSRER